MDSKNQPKVKNIYKELTKAFLGNQPPKSDPHKNPSKGNKLEEKVLPLKKKELATIEDLMDIAENEIQPATIPEPNPNETVFATSHKVNVRMATLNAASPLGSIRPIDPQ